MAGICTGQCLRAPLQSVTGNQPRDSHETDGRHKRLSNALYRKGILRANHERLKKAETLLNSESNIYAGPSAAKALLSRVYLYMGNNKLAAEYATEIIESSGRTLLEGEAYATANVLVPEDNPEIIFAIRCTKDKDDYGWNSIGGFYANIDGVGWGELYASEPLRDAYAEYPEDLRSRYIVPQYER